MTCRALSLNQYSCVKPEGHDGDHERFDGRTWPEGQTWGDVIGEFFRRQGIDPDDPACDQPKESK